MQCDELVFLLRLLRNVYFFNIFLGLVICFFVFLNYGFIFFVWGICCVCFLNVVFLMFFFCVFEELDYVYDFDFGGLVYMYFIFEICRI